MEDLESQVAKIQIGNFKKTNSYVFLTAEQAAGSPCELYVIAELPLLNPAALEASEQICLAIASALKRTYKRQTNENTFENGVAHINEELGKLASMGQAHWIDKLSCIVASKEKDTFSIATCGKIAAYLLRNGELTDISCSAQTTHPLKAFENIANGKLKLQDILILSTTQLFNYVSADRLKNILAGNFLTATQNTIEILKTNAGPKVAFGTIISLQVPFGETTDEQIDLDQYVTEQTTQKITFLEKAKSFFASTFALDKTKRVSAAVIPQISILEKLKKITSKTERLYQKSSLVLTLAGKKVLNSRESLNLENFKALPRQKKIFMFSLLVLLLAFVVNVYLTSHYKKTKTSQVQATTSLQEVQDIINKAQSLLIFKNESSAKNLLAEAENKLPNLQTLSDSQKQTYENLKNQIKDIRDKTEKVVTVQTANLGNLGQAEQLFSFPPFIATQINKSIISFNQITGLTQDNALLSSEKITGSVYTTKSSAVVYNGKSLLLWDYQKKLFSPAFSQSMPSTENFIGLAYYPVNNRVYLIDKSTKQIISFAVGTDISKPVVVSKESGDLENAIDLAIDGSVYVLKTNGISKYQAGKLANFKLPELLTPFSGKGHIATEVNWKYIYVLDSGNNRVLVIDKKGNLISSLKSPNFTNLKDFLVDENNKIILLLNESSLLKVTLP